MTGINNLKADYISEKSIGDEVANELSKNNDQQQNLPSLRRQVLAVHYLLKHSGMAGIDLTEEARFIQFVTGRQINTKKIQNTTIYRMLREPFPHDEKSLREDLQYLRVFFEKLEMSDIVEEINKEISKGEKKNIGRPPHPPTIK